LNEEVKGKSFSALIDLYQNTANKYKKGQTLLYALTLCSNEQELKTAVSVASTLAGEINLTPGFSIISAPCTLHDAVTALVQKRAKDLCLTGDYSIEYKDKNPGRGKKEKVEKQPKAQPQIQPVQQPIVTEKLTLASVSILLEHGGYSIVPSTSNPLTEEQLADCKIFARSLLDLTRAKFRKRDGIESPSLFLTGEMSIDNMFAQISIILLVSKHYLPEDEPLGIILYVVSLFANGFYLNPMKLFGVLSRMDKNAVGVLNTFFGQKQHRWKYGNLNILQGVVSELNLSGIDISSLNTQVDGKDIFK